ncbi:MAG: hypothetical protein KAW00_01030, partial [Dehalococcoidia bacterium]|nr:hypothetical protein [Dehalococcoidia bacterium]
HHHFVLFTEEFAVFLHSNLHFVFYVAKTVCRLPQFNYYSKAVLLTEQAYSPSLDLSQPPLVCAHATGDII